MHLWDFLWTFAVSLHSTTTQWGRLCHCPIWHIYIYIYIYTGGKGCVKVWDLQLTQTGVYSRHHPIHSHWIAWGTFSKLLPDGRTSIMGGETNTPYLWDLAVVSWTMDYYLNWLNCWSINFGQYILYSWSHWHNIKLYHHAENLSILVAHNVNPPICMIGYSSSDYDCNTCNGTYRYT